MVQTWCKTEVPHCCSGYHDSHLSWPGIEPRSPRLKTGTWLTWVRRCAEQSTCGRTNSILSVQWAQCVSAWLLNCKWCLRPATVAVCKMQRHGMSRYSDNPALSAWHTIRTAIASLSVMCNMGWAVTNVTCNACDLVCDECHIWRVWSWFMTNVTCDACFLVCDDCHM